MLETDADGSWLSEKVEAYKPIIEIPIRTPRGVVGKGGFLTRHGFEDCSFIGR